MTQTGHDLLAWRLAAILQKLNQGERLDPDELATEFNVHKRTIQRDLLERFAFLPLEREDGRFVLDQAYLGRITVNDIARFAGLAGLIGLFPALDTQFIRELFDSRLQDTLRIHGGSYEDIRSRRNDFRVLQEAISAHKQVSFNYRSQSGETKRVHVAPYRLVNHTGIWYLAATNDGKVKTYAFSRIGMPTTQDETFTSDPDIKAMLDGDDSVWFSENKVEIILSVDPSVAPYFRRRKLIAQQIIVKELQNGGLIVSGKFAHPNQILPIVRYWIPHVRIISPEDWQTEMERELQTYLNA